MTSDVDCGDWATCFHLDDDLDEDDEDDEDEEDKEPGDDDADDEDEDEDEDEDDDDVETWQVFAPTSIPLKATNSLTSGSELPRLAQIS